ncbi:Hypothetical protein CINCED_3A002521 [Cinara cedri]|uniref:Uncharacterized protein n=1 Tax=Cinara cedri TaxID=506608 RepID=A0A5E4MNA7_9HEMI|nr:Hypothetical protein CINCED_3A002521 [Cinara cedri]
MDRWLNKSKTTVGSSSSDANENICIATANSASLIRANSPANKHADTVTSDTTKNKNIIAEVSKTTNAKATEASYMVSYRIAQAGKARTIAESLIRPRVTDIVSCMLDEKAVEKINTIPLSNHTVRRRINDISTRIKSELISRLKCNHFSLQTDESTDVSGLAVSLVFVRHKLPTLVVDLLRSSDFPRSLRLRKECGI